MNSAISERFEDRSRAERASHYMECARQLRIKAATLTTPDARMLLLATAAAYERLAKLAKKDGT